ncbi:Chemotaxis response regulator protein-glutamate methylesterase CheB [hydrothermal vent metagenome]|uniref:protein-glutamate methylesterase n=1 Tax=hydrothermal vent metagenome TaxID=652676 RepID=A0A3B1AEH3_9ZZZZ
MPMSENTTINVSIASESAQLRNQLQTALERNGLCITVNEPLSFEFISKLDSCESEVLIIDLDENSVIDDKLLDEVLENISIPIIFNDVAAMSGLNSKALIKWHCKLTKKIIKVAGYSEQFDTSNLDSQELICRPPAMYESQEMSLSNIHLNHLKLAQNVWVLGASLGGPEAVKRFLNSLDPNIDASFILAQHLGSNFVKLLAEQITRTTPFKAMKPRAGHVLRHGEILVTPVSERLMINPIGAVELRELQEPAPYSPSIDLVIEDVAKRFGTRSGAIIFSGMGDDGSNGIELMSERGAVIWAQDADSCVISSMPDQARDTGLVSFSGTPEALAKNLNKFLGVD